MLSAWPILSFSMYPPHVSDLDVQATIRSLRRGMQLPSGAELRRALHERFGFRGGVSRIYRLLEAERFNVTEPSPAPPGHTEGNQLEEWRRRAEQAEAREDAHQLRWAREIDELRTKVAELAPLAERSRRAEQDQLLLREQLRAAQSRILTLEEALLATHREAR